MSTVNLTIRVDADTKKAFDEFCENVGLNATSAVNMFIKNVVRTREIPFTVTDGRGMGEREYNEMMQNYKKAVESMHEESLRNGNVNMTSEEINAEIDACRREMGEL